MNPVTGIDQSTLRRRLTLWLSVAVVGLLVAITVSSIRDSDGDGDGEAAASPSAAASGQPAATSGEGGEGSSGSSAPPVSPSQGPDGSATEAGSDGPGAETGFRSTQTAVTPARGSTLILYDSEGEWGFTGEIYAQMIGNLVSRYNLWEAKPVIDYTSQELFTHDSVVYIGSTFDEPLPPAFLDDTLAGTVPVMWINHNIWQLADRADDFTKTYGWRAADYDLAPVDTITYKGVDLTRYRDNGAGIMTYATVDDDRVETLGQAVRDDGTTFPWALRSENLTYIGEVPVTYTDHRDRYLAFADMVIEFLNPSASERHRALVRIEDVGPNTQPDDLRAIADLLSERDIPFSVAVYTRYVDPHGENNGGTPQAFDLAERPKVVEALHYMEDRGGTLLMHGHTHQYSDQPNPYNGVSSDDFEFYLTHVNEEDYVIFDGPVPEDSVEWALGRVDAAQEALHEAGLDTPAIFEFPHYAGSVDDYDAIGQRFSRRYERGLYFPGFLSGGEIDYSKASGQFFPYPVVDVYGAFIVPENIGNVIPTGFNNNPARSPEDLIATAETNLVIRDGYASFFYHPYLGTEMLEETIDGIEDLGYTFVAPDTVN